MKRTAILLAALLLTACAAPSAGKPAAAQAISCPDSPIPAETFKAESASTEETVTLDRSACTPAPELMPVPAEVRFRDKFAETPAYGERSYKSRSVDVTVKTYSVRDTYAKIVGYHVADIYVKDATQIRAAAAGGDFGMRYESPVREIAKNVGALIAIDGDTYARVKNSFVIRNGVLYRDTPIEDTDVCVLYRDGRMETKKWGSSRRRRSSTPIRGRCGDSVPRCSTKTDTPWRSSMRCPVITRAPRSAITSRDTTALWSSTGGITTGPRGCGLPR